MAFLQSLSMVGTLAVLLAALEPSARPTVAPVQIDVVATDYAFGPLPAHIAAGPTVFTFANHGSVQHEMSIARLKAGATPEGLVKVVRDGGPRRDIIERWVGLLISGPGKSPDGRLLVDLLPATTYVILCNLKDSPDAPGHLTLGMYKSFRTE